MPTYDVAIEDFKWMVKKGFDRQTALISAAKSHGLDHHDLAQKMSERSRLRHKHHVEASTLLSVPNETERWRQKDEADRIARLKGFGIPDEARDVGLEPEEVV